MLFITALESVLSIVLIIALGFYLRHKGYFIAWLMTKWLKVRSGQRGVFINTIVNTNTIFIGLPLNISLFGDNSMPYFLVYYVLNTVSTWTFGAWLIARGSSQPQTKQHTHFNWRKLWGCSRLATMLYYKNEDNIL
ncbi:AEC family transporter [Avibacterium avium]|uniref:AEC family transporter n=1 Tax=Avibacterium avium TaxID=751 RepID=UPI003BF7C861